MLIYYRKLIMMNKINSRSKKSFPISGDNFQLCKLFTCSSHDKTLPKPTSFGASKGEKWYPNKIASNSPSYFD